MVAGVECCGGRTDKCTPTAVVSKVMSVHLRRFLTVVWTQQGGKKRRKALRESTARELKKRHGAQGMVQKGRVVK
ncbi:hypothetical protein E2C01_102309 [Portunus trituberculatus]|uniref:Uncharacterized protein n=1 Tax=Portunus trituberculatus TaxID=210409 RepID=A0A5B7KNW5_PORTR|nr:hypothetical protein [Portunus trituberculatus]